MKAKNLQRKIPKKTYVKYNSVISGSNSIFEGRRLSPKRIEELKLHLKRSPFFDAKKKAKLRAELSRTGSESSRRAAVLIYPSEMLAGFHKESPQLTLKVVDRLVEEIGDKPPRLEDQFYAMVKTAEIMPKLLEQVKRRNRGPYTFTFEEPIIGGLGARRINFVVIRDGEGWKILKVKTVND